MWSLVPFVLAVAANPAGVLPQNSEAPLTLAEALDLAAARNEVPAIARARLSRAQAARQEAYANLFPVLSSNASYTRRAYEVRRTFGTQEVVVQKYDALQADLQLNWDLFDARAFAGISASNHQVEAQAHESAELLRNLAFEVAESFYAVISAERLADAADKRLSAALATAADAKGRFEAGLAPRNEATRTELEVANARLALQEAKTAVVKARLSLSFLIDQRLDTRPVVEPERRPIPTETPVDLELRAKEQRADLQALKARTEQARAQATEPWLRLIPTLGLRGLVRASNETGLVGQTIDGNVAATLSWTLFDGGIRYAQAAQLAAALEELEQNQAASERRVGLELRGVLADLADAEASVEQAEVRSQVAIQNAEEVRALFGTGLASALEQVDAAVSEFEAAAELARQRVRRRVAELSLFRVLGDWPLEARGESDAKP